MNVVSRLTGTETPTSGNSLDPLPLLTGLFNHEHRCSWGQSCFCCSRTSSAARGESSLHGGALCPREGVSARRSQSLKGDSRQGPTQRPSRGAGVPGAEFLAESKLSGGSLPPRCVRNGM